MAQSKVVLVFCTVTAKLPKLQLCDIQFPEAVKGLQAACTSDLAEVGSHNLAQLFHSPTACIPRPLPPKAVASAWSAVKLSDRVQEVGSSNQAVQPASLWLAWMLPIGQLLQRLHEDYQPVRTTHKPACILCAYQASCHKSVSANTVLLNMQAC